jgi:hypothetical protein
MSHSRHILVKLVLSVSLDTKIVTVMGEIIRAQTVVAGSTNSSCSWIRHK